jgi:hypothetical protein
MKWWHFVFVLFTTAVQAQDSVRYSSSYMFKDGVYFSFDAFRRNAPDVPKAAITSSQGARVMDLKSAGGRLFFPDSAGTRVRLDLDHTWGFCDNGVVYIRAGDSFSRIGLMGSLAHLVYDATYRNFDAYTMGGSTSYTVEEQRFLDMATGDFLPVSAAGLYKVISRDPVLKEEFDAMKKKDRNKQETLFLFMRRYNDRHPLYFPG